MNWVMKNSLAICDYLLSIILYADDIFEYKIYNNMIVIFYYNTIILLLYYNTIIYLYNTIILLR